MIFTIAGKDLKSLFTSPIAWVVLTFVQLIVGYGFLKSFDDFMALFRPGRTWRRTAPTDAPWGT